MRDYNEPISDAGNVVGDGLVQRIKDLEEEIERMTDAAAFDRAIFSGERRIRQAAITRALAAETERDALREALAAAKVFQERQRKELDGLYDERHLFLIDKERQRLTEALHAARAALEARP